MPPLWGASYCSTLRERFFQLTQGLPDRLESIETARVTPGVEDIAIGSAKSVRAAVLFFDICRFTERARTPFFQDLKRTLLMLDCVIPMVMHVVHDYGGYVEKNTGDGVMAILGVGEPDHSAASSALDTAAAIGYVLRTIVNPYLIGLGIEEVEARIGIDLGRLLLARIGVPTGSARHERSFLTAVGPAANLACLLQESADPGQVWVGDLVKTNAPSAGLSYFNFDFEDRTPPLGWTWTYVDNSERYRIWRYTRERTDADFPLLAELLQRFQTR